MTASSSSRCRHASACGRMRSTSSAAVSAADSSAMNISTVYVPSKRPVFTAASTCSATGVAAPTRSVAWSSEADERRTARYSASASTAEITWAVVCSVYAARASCAEPAPPVSCTVPAIASSTGRASATASSSPPTKHTRLSRSPNASARATSTTTSGASTDMRSLTTATAFSSRAKLGVDADRSMSSAPFPAACTSPCSSKYASSSAVCDVQYVMMASACATSSVRVQPAASRRDTTIAPTVSLPEYTNESSI